LCGVVLPLASLPVFAGSSAAAGFLALLVFRPKVLWLVLMTVLPFSVELENRLGAGTNITLPTEALVPVAALALGFAVFRAGKLRWTLSPLHLAGGVFLAVQLLSPAVSPLPFVTLKAFVRTSSYFLCGYVLTQSAVRSLRDARLLFYAAAASTSALTVYGFYTQFVEGVSIYQDIAHPFFLNHCIYAAWLCFPAAVCTAALTQPIRGKTPIAAVLSLLGFGILLTFVRGAWLGMAAMVGYLVYRRRGRLDVRLVLWAIVLAIVGAAVVTALGLGHLFAERFENLFDRRYVTNDSRIDRWMAALSMWAARPILGMGLGCYPDLYPQFIYFVDAFERDIRMGAHSIYLEILAELGIVGFSAYCFVLVSFFRETRRLFRLAGGDPGLRAAALGLEGAMVVYLVHGVFNNLGPSDKIDIAFWTICGLAAALRAAAERDRSNRPDEDGTGPRPPANRTPSTV